MYFIDVDLMRQKRFSLMKHYVFWLVAGVTILSLGISIFLPYDDGPDWIIAIVPNLATELFGILVAVILVDFYLSNQRSSARVQEIHHNLKTAYSGPLEFIDAIDERLNTADCPSFDELGRQYITGQNRLETLQPQHVAELVKAAADLMRDYRVHLRYGARRLHDLVLAYTINIEPSDSAALLQASHAMELICESAEGMNIEMPTFGNAIFHLGTNLRGFASEIERN